MEIDYKVTPIQKGMNIGKFSLEIIESPDTDKETCNFVGVYDSYELAEQQGSRAVRVNSVRSTGI